MVRSTNFDSIPLGSYFVIRINACKGYQFDLDPTTGLVPASNQDTTIFLAATGTPTFGVKTRTNAFNAATAFAAYANGYATDYTSLANGQVAIGAIFPLTTTPDLDYMAQMTLRGALETPMVALPVSWLPVDIQNPVVTGGETGSVPSPGAYSGKVTIPAVDGYLNISIPGLTVATGTVVSLVQQDNGYGLTTFLPTITANNLKITASNSDNDWVVVYTLGSL